MYSALAGACTYSIGEEDVEGKGEQKQRGGGKQMQVRLEVEIDSNGIIGQMEKVRDAEIKMRQEMDRLNEMLRTASAKETGNSEESPASV